MNCPDKRSLRRFFAAACIVAGIPAIAPADSPAGIGGVVIDAVSQQPVSALIAFRRSGSSVATIVPADRHGFFIALELEPGRYAVTATASGRTATCDLDVDDGEVRRYRITIAASPQAARCEAPAGGGLVDPNQSADLYRIH